MRLQPLQRHIKLLTPSSFHSIRRTLHLLQAATHGIFHGAGLTLPGELGEPAHHLVHALVFDVEAHAPHFRTLSTICGHFLPSASDITFARPGTASARRSVMFPR